ncbi:unnamed protein product [Brachionus calyciflorus]|uniref:Nose resistant-to-fluoxetine protein N-terminal domain-containing protein n=1 Tax=Brachionus calyciflorus TaxID=104777 RepID=A0A813M4N9_9BILA|nr:unnamed protein product [Brachionus calyciflorus]
MKKILFLIFYLILLSEAKNFNRFITEILGDITIDNNLNLETQCFNQMKTWLKSIESNETWALNVIDSFGRRPSGFLAGNVVWPGQYSQCIKIKSSEWSSKYCYINKRIQWVNILNRNDTLRFVNKKKSY